MQNFVFVYILDGNYMCLGTDEAHVIEKQLIKEGWKHTATINPETWMEKFLNGDETTRLEVIESISK